MELTTILKAVSEYGVPGFGWVAWILTMFYLQVERKQYQALVIYIIQYFMHTNINGHKPPSRPTEFTESKAFQKLFGRGVGSMIPKQDDPPEE